MTMLRDSVFSDATLKALAHQAERMEVLSRAVMFFKPAERAPRWVQSWDYAAQAKLASKWFHLATAIAGTGGPAERALEAARHAAALAPDDLEIRLRLAWMLNRAGYPQQAAAEANRLLARPERGPRLGAFEATLLTLAEGATREGA